MGARQLADNSPATADLRRITENDPALKRLKARTVRQLTQSVHQLVSDLRNGVDQHTAQSRFIQRHTALMRSAYEAAHEEGQRDYYGAVSRVPSKWSQQPPDEATTAQRMGFYAPSVAKMAFEAGQAAHQTRAQQVIEAVRTFADKPPTGDALTQWEQGNVGARIVLQADLTWSGAQDGYVAAGFGDSANPYSTLWWNLEPTAEHCDQCPMLAAASPYDPPWVNGGNILNATPGDGHTDCGAACRCDLSYGGAIGSTQTQDMKAWLPQDMPDLPDGPMQPTQPPAQKQPQPQQQPQAPTRQPPSPFEPAPPRQSPYGPMIPGGEFNAGQKAALDLYRLAELEWNKVRGDLAELPNFFTLANPNFTWERFRWDDLTRAQRQALSHALEAFARWMANVPSEWLDYYDE